MFNTIHTALNGEPRHGDYHVDCPWCGKPAKPGQTHFSYNERGYHCFVCGASGGLAALARHLKIAQPRGGGSPRPKPEPKPLPVFAKSLLTTYTHHPARYEAWHQYRGILPRTVDQFQLGYGRLPGKQFMYTVEGLILPVFDKEGRCRTLRARTRKGWLTAGGRMLYAPLGVPVGATIIVVENCANCCLVAQTAPWLTPLAPTTGAASWNAAWIDHIAARAPSLVIVAGDDDEAGQRMNERWALALELAGVAVRTTIFTEAFEKELSYV